MKNERLLPGEGKKTYPLPWRERIKVRGIK
jgi:hypothetical protein